MKWMLLEPKEGEWDFAYYDMVVAETRAQVDAILACLGLATGV